MLDWKSKSRKKTSKKNDFSFLHLNRTVYILNGSIADL